MGFGQGRKQIVGILLRRFSPSYSSLSSKMRDQRSENAGYQGGIFSMKNEVVTSISPSRTTTKKRSNLLLQPLLLDHALHRFAHWSCSRFGPFRIGIPLHLFFSTDIAVWLSSD